MDTDLIRYGLGAIVTVIGFGLRALPQRWAHYAGVACIGVGLVGLGYVLTYPATQPYVPPPAPPSPAAALPAPVPVPAPAPQAQPAPTAPGHPPAAFVFKTIRGGKINLKCTGIANCMSAEDTKGVIYGDLESRAAPPPKP